jgi:hypothetical protein
MILLLLLLSGITTLYESEPPQLWCYEITHKDSSGQVISPSQRPLPDNTQRSQETDIQAPGGIRTRNLINRSAAGLRPLGHWDRLPFRDYKQKSRYTK